MFDRFGYARIDGIFEIDGYIDANEYLAAKTAGFILERLEDIKG